MRKIFLLSTLPVLAATQLFAGAPPTEPILQTPQKSDWQFQVSPYLWLAGIKGTSAVPALPASEVDASFGDIWDNLDFAGFLAFEARHNQWRLFGDFQYINLGADAQLQTGQTLNLDIEQVRLEIGASYEVYRSESTSLELYAAAMYNYLDQELSLRDFSPSVSESWVDPALGFTLRHQWSEQWNTQLTAEYGGFGVSSDQTWQAIALLGYQLTPQWTLTGGYRHQSIDYEKDGFVYDTDTYGPFLGAAYSF